MLTIRPHRRSITLTAPTWSWVTLTPAATLAGSPTSMSTPKAEPPSRLIRSASSKARSRFRPAITTVRPSRASPCAIADPMPPAPPVMSATRPFRPSSISAHPTAGWRAAADGSPRDGPLLFPRPFGRRYASQVRQQAAADEDLPLTGVEIVLQGELLIRIADERGYRRRPGAQLFLQLRKLPGLADLGLVVVRLVGERQGHDALRDQVAPVDAGE